MNVPKNIKRFWMWVGIALLVELAAFTLWKRWYWFFPSHAVSEVYTRYADTDGLNVVFFKDYKINDTVYVDVTYIEATTDSSWNEIKRDFQISIPPEIIDLYDSNSVDLKYAPHNNYTAPMDSIILNNDIIVYAYLKRTILVFEIENEKQNNAIINHQILSTNTKKQSK